MSDADRLYGRKTRKNYSSPLMNAFGVSILLLIAYVLGYVICFALAGNIGIEETGGFFTVWGPPMAVGIIVSAIACIPMRFLKNPTTIAAGMAFLALYYAAIAIGMITAEGIADAGMTLYVWSFFCLPCVIPGNLFAWLAWAYLRKHPREDKK